MFPIPVSVSFSIIPSKAVRQEFVCISHQFSEIGTGVEKLLKMKLLTLSSLSEAVTLLDGMESRGGEYELNAKLEAYSCIEPFK